MKKPRNDPRKIGAMERFHSASVGRRSRIRTRIISPTPSFSTALSMTSAIPKSPMATGRNSTPCPSSLMPKVNRGVAKRRSVPIVASARPRRSMRRFLTSEPPLSRTRKMRPTAPMAKNSGGPNFRAASARSEAANMRPMIERVPATKDPTAEMVRAAPPRPFRAIW
jgi:hypothetical protein